MGMATSRHICPSVMGFLVRSSCSRRSPALQWESGELAEVEAGCAPAVFHDDADVIILAHHAVKLDGPWDPVWWRSDTHEVSTVSNTTYFFWVT